MAKAKTAEAIITDGIRSLLKLRLPDACTNEIWERTPARFIRAFFEMTRGYEVNIADLLATTFECESDEMVILRDVPFVSLCEHHLMPFLGRAHLGYVPRGSRVIGLSKLARLVDALACRLQLQERLAFEIADNLQTALSPRGVGVVIEATHCCLSCRGAKKPDAVMVTSAMLGCFRDERETRAEFLALIK